MAELEPIAFKNGKFIRQSDLSIAFDDAGFIFGATVTDRIRTFRHQPFRLADHLARFRRSCELACIPQPVADEELSRIIGELLLHNTRLIAPEQDLSIVLFATPGPIGHYVGQSGEGSTTLGIHTLPLSFGRFAGFFERGVTLLTPSIRQIPAECVDPHIKQRSRLHYWLAEQEMQRRDPAASALLLDLHGRFTETAAANFLMVRDGVVLSPPADSILGGISLQVVRELCAELSIPFKEQNLTIDDCLHADEAMLSNTSYCLASVSRIDDRAIPWPGKVYLQLLERWNQLVGLDIRQQILANR